MSRVKRGVMTKKRHKRVIKAASGWWGQRKNIFKRAKETLLRAWAYAFVGRKERKRNFRALFIIRTKAACEQRGLKYSRFIHMLKTNNVSLNRKVLSQLAIFDPRAFDAVVQKVS